MDKEIWIEWAESFGPASEPVYMRASRTTVIAHQRAIHPYPPTPYGDDLALEDFIAVNWASIREDSALSLYPKESPLSSDTPTPGACIE